MKKIILAFVSLFISISAYADITIQTQGLANTDGVFVQSLETGTQINAINAGEYAVITDSQLAQYKSGSPFVVGILLNNSTALAYCSTTKEEKNQFVLKFNQTTNNLIKLTMMKSPSDGMIPVCHG